MSGRTSASTTWTGAQPGDFAVGMLAVLVRAHRLRLGLTQEELAERAGIGLRTIRDVETGRVRTPRPATVRLLSDAFGLQGSQRDQFCIVALWRRGTGDLG